MSDLESQSESERAPRTVDLAGISVDVPPGWEVRARQDSSKLPADTTRPVVHAATVPLPADRADYGGGVVETLGPDDIFITLVEFAREAANSALFAATDSFPDALDPAKFHPRQLQRIIPGQAGLQVFFSYRGRPFCLYVVIGSAAFAGELASRANQLLTAITIDELENS